MVGRDWSHSGITSLFRNIRANGYKFMYLTSRAIAQADATRDYLTNLSQVGERERDNLIRDSLWLNTRVGSDVGSSEKRRFLVVVRNSYPAAWTDSKGPSPYSHGREMPPGNPGGCWWTGRTPACSERSEVNTVGSGCCCVCGVAGRRDAAGWAADHVAGRHHHLAVSRGDSQDAARVQDRVAADHPRALPGVLEPLLRGLWQPRNGRALIQGGAGAAGQDLYHQPQLAGDTHACAASSYSLRPPLFPQHRRPKVPRRWWVFV